MSSLREQIVALVHADTRVCPVEQARHSCFIAGRLAASFALLAILPPYLIYHGLPTRWEVLLLVWLMIPPAAVLLVVRTGRLALAQALCMVSTAGAVVTIYAADPSRAAVVAWLVLLPLEGLFLERVGSIVAACIAATAVVLILNAAAHGHGGAARVAGVAAFVLPPLVYATGLVFGLLYVGDVRNGRQRELAQQLGAMVEVAGDAVLWIDRLGAVVSATDGVEGLLGAAPQALRGRGLFERINVADRPAYLKAVADAAAASTPLRVALRLRRTKREGGHADESEFCRVELRLLRFPARTDQAFADAGAAIVAVARDLGEDLARGGASATATLEADRDPWRDRFLPIVSHELRTPLNAIIGFSEMLSSAELAPRDAAKQREYAEIINSSGQHLLAVVNSILDVSKIESGSFDIVPEPFSVASLIDASCDMVRLKIVNADLELVRACDPALPPLVADKRACKQILINLLSNAIKFTPKGGRIVVGARREAADCVLFVTDTGIGIAARDLPRLGMPFFQAQDSYDRRYEGTGLGLSIVRGLVGLHGGTIAVTSAPGAGTSVEVRLPLDPARERGQAPGVARIETIHRIPTSHAASAEATKVKKIA